MAELPEGRKALTWDDLKPPFSTWEGEAKALRTKQQNTLAHIEAAIEAQLDGHPINQLRLLMSLRRSLL